MCGVIIDSGYVDQERVCGVVIDWISCGSGEGVIDCGYDVDLERVCGVIIDCGYVDQERVCGVIIDWISCGSGEGVWCYHRLDIMWTWRGCVVLS